MMLEMGRQWEEDVPCRCFQLVPLVFYLLLLDLEAKQRPRSQNQMQAHTDTPNPPPPEARSLPRIRDIAVT